MYTTHNSYHTSKLPAIVKTHAGITSVIAITPKYNHCNYHICILPACIYHTCRLRTLIAITHVGRRVRRYQRGNRNPYIEEEQTTQWPKEKVQKEKQRSTKHTYKNKDRETRTPLKTGGELSAIALSHKNTTRYNNHICILPAIAITQEY